MIVDIKPGIPKGTISAPPSKSMAHRLLICAGLAKGESKIRGIDFSRDVKATLDCLTAIGAKYTYEDNTVTICGVNPKTISATTPLPCYESGSTLRFFVPICLTSPNNTVLCGEPSLMSRPMGVYKTLCDEKGLFFSQDNNSVMLRGPLAAGNFKIPGNISSQFISGLLFALPLLDKTSTITILPPVESVSYIKLTMQALNQFGIKAEYTDERTITIPGNQEYTPCDISVEGDYSNAAFFAALNTMGGQVSCTNLKPDSLQGDKVYDKYFCALKKGTPTLHISNCPDLGPILFAVAAANNGGVFTGTRRLKIKESDRGNAMATELAKFGVSATVYEDEIVILPHDLHPPEELLCGYNDHRIVMSLAILASVTGGSIEGCEAVEKSFPNFFNIYRNLGIEVSFR